MIKAHGTTYETIADAQARWDALEADNLRIGYSDGRVTEQVLIKEAIGAATQPEDVWAPGSPCRNCGGPTLAARPDHPEEEGEYCEACGYAQDAFTVDKNDYEVPCEHPLCEQLHQRFMVTVEGIDEQGRYAKERSHMKTNREWVILLNGERVNVPMALDGPFETKRAALAAIAHHFGRKA